MNGYTRFMLGAAIFNGLVIAAVLVTTVVRGDAFGSAILGVTLGIWLSVILLRFRHAGVRPLADSLVWLGDQPWTGHPGDWLLRRFSLVEDGPYDPRRGE